MNAVLNTADALLIELTDGNIENTPAPDWEEKFHRVCRAAFEGR
jgi:hypothetical protein